MFGYDRKHGFYVYDPTTNYCGPNYSDGKVQPSVIHGESETLNTRDANCRAHDTCYAIANSDSDAFDRCDNSFYERSKKDNILGKAYGYAVLYGNRLTRKKTNSLHKSKDKMAQTQDTVYMPSGNFTHPTMKGKGGGAAEFISQIAQGAAAAASTLCAKPSTEKADHVSDIAKSGLVMLKAAEAKKKLKEAEAKLAYAAKRQQASDTPPSTGQANKSKVSETPKAGRGANAPDSGHGGFIHNYYGAYRVQSKYSSKKKKKKKGILASIHNIKNKLNRVHLA